MLRVIAALLGRLQFLLDFSDQCKMGTIHPKLTRFIKHIAVVIGAFAILGTGLIGAVIHDSVVVDRNRTCLLSKVHALPKVGPPPRLSAAARDELMASCGIAGTFGSVADPITDRGVWVFGRFPPD